VRTSKLAVICTAVRDVCRRWLVTRGWPPPGALPARAVAADGATANRSETLDAATAGAAIRAVVEGTGLSLGDAKWVVHRNLDPEVRTAAEHLWDELIGAMMTVEQPPTDPNATR